MLDELQDYEKFWPSLPPEPLHVAYYACTHLRMRQQEIPSTELLFHLMFLSLQPLSPILCSVLPAPGAAGMMGAETLRFAFVMP